MAESAQPTAILRGHRSQVHAVEFVRVGSQLRLATGDSDGYVVLWDLAIVRPRAVWRAHENSILSLACWLDEDTKENEVGQPCSRGTKEAINSSSSNCQIVTHGRDHKLIVWQLGLADEERLSTTLPLDLDHSGSFVGGNKEKQQETLPRPWMVHVLHVNAMNFCAFAWCRHPPTMAAMTRSERLVAVPNALTLEAVDIFQLPSQQRINSVKLGEKDGMLMALALFFVERDDESRVWAEGGREKGEEGVGSGTLTLIAAFENGAAVVATLDDGVSGPATIRYRAQSHSQPILSLDVAPNKSYFLTSGADAIIAKHPIPTFSSISINDLLQSPSADMSQTNGASDNSKPPQNNPSPVKPVSLLSTALAKEKGRERSGNFTKAEFTATTKRTTVILQPLKTLDTKHAGQQGLRVRQDGRIFATAGWDGRARVYSTKTMKEVAVLKWHQTGCFATAFAPVDVEKKVQNRGESSSNNALDSAILCASSSSRHEISVKERRLRHAATAHWLAIGSKDGKVSLWDIF